jgi:AAA domain
MNPDARILLQALGDDGYLSACWEETPGGKFRWRVGTPATALAKIDEIGDTTNVWYGVNRMAGPPARGGRGEATDITRVTCLWADLDPDKPGYPGSLEEALTIIDGLPDPAFIIHSGHGAQPIWLLTGDEFDTGTPERHADITGLMKRWGQLISSRARARDWDVDPVWDLARILRVPGTLNLKDPARPVRARLEQVGGAALTYGEVLGLLAEHEHRPAVSSAQFQQPAQRAPTSYTAPDVDALVTRGITEGSQDNQLRDVVWDYVRAGMSKIAIRAVWDTIAARTPRLKPGDWTGNDFDRHYDGAIRKLAATQGTAAAAPPAGHVPAAAQPAAALPVVDLVQLAAAGIKEPERIAGGMLYRGSVHDLAGQPGGGKTTVLCWWLLTHIRDAGTVMFLDEESGAEQATEKLLDLGATPAELAAVTYVPFPARSWNAADVAQLHDLIRVRQPGIIAFDSVAAFLAIAGQDENSATDVTAFWQRVLVPCARQFGAAVVAVDHTGKADHGGYGRGSGAKKAASDVQYIAETVKPFSRSQDGLLRLTTSPGKDRRGWLPMAWEIRVRTGRPLRLEITELADGAAGAPDMPPAKAKLLEALTAIGSEDTPVTARVLVDWIVEHYGHGLTRQTYSKHLNELKNEGIAGVVDLGTGRDKLWFPSPSVTAYPSPCDRDEGDDPDADAGSRNRSSGTRKPVADASPPTYPSTSPPSIGGDDDDTPRRAAAAAAAAPAQAAS